jgi:lysozyme
MEIIKLKDIIMELDTPPPMVKFEMPPKVTNVSKVNSPTQPNNIYQNKNVDFSRTEDPSFEEYKTHFVKYEGKKNKPYIDSRGFKTVGIGHKFEKGESSKSSYTDHEIDVLFKADLNDAIKDAKSVFSTFDTLPKEVKIKLVSLTFNLGKNGIDKFKKFKIAILNKDWDGAADELVDSRWYNQTGNRAKDYVNFFRNIT